MIYCIWYPSGGFGHFINGILTLHGKDFKRPTNTIKFSTTGNSHNLDLVAPKYTKYTKNYNYNFDSNCNYSVLIDLGINSNGSDFMAAFPDSTVIKLCYTDTSWPVVANTMISKAMNSTIEVEVPVDPVWPDEPWAQREKYFLFLRDHYLRNAWNIESGANCITIESLTNYATLKNAIETTGIELLEFTNLWNDWYTHNKRYFDPVLTAQKVVDVIRSTGELDLTSITDVWTQAVIYYFIWIEFSKEIPHNDFKNFFNNVCQIRTWIHQ